MKHLWMILVILSACLALATSASAKNSHTDKHDKDRDDVKRHDRDDVKRHDRDDVKRHDRDADDRKFHARRGDRDDDRDGDRDRNRHQHKFHARKHRDNDDEREVFIPRHDRRPPGWDHGRKVGWGGCNVPPGQAKKMGCDRDHSRDHRIEAQTKPVIVRRPVIRRPTARVTAEGRATATVN